MPVRARFPSFRRPAQLLAAMALASVGFTGPGAAEDGFHPLDSTLEFMNLKATPGAMPDFVERSRPDTSTQTYIGIGSKPADRTLKAKTPAEVKALTAELDAARAAQIAGKRPKPPGAPADKAAPKKPLPKTATSH
jgi:hypothetical protein